MTSPRNENTSSALQQYRRKRNFSATPEPGLKPNSKRARRAKALRFVVQKHAASHLHYDFRLELDGTLKSWAIPKGPSLDPKQRRLAMQVEDHPLDYADFEGVIPAGNYGAGTVIVWDNGEWQPLDDPERGYRSGKLKFALRGKKLTGIWNLVRSHAGKNKNAWLLIKHEDDAARPSVDYSIVDDMPDSVLGGRKRAGGATKPTAASVQTEKKAKAQPSKSKTASKKAAATRAGERADRTQIGAAQPLPLTLAPQLATLVDSLPAGNDWMYEIKFDGYRILARIDEGSARLFTRNGNDWSGKLPHLRRALEKLDVAQAWLDGEIIVMDKRQRADFQQLQNAFENSTTAKIQYYLFDLLYLDGRDLRGEPLRARRQLLERLLQKPPARIFLSQTFDVPPRELLAHVCDLQLEGLIGKRGNSPYYSGRSREWIKLKCLQRQEFIICGYTDPTGSREGTFGSLLLGYHDPKSGELRYAGRVGTGFTHTSARELFKKMQPLQREHMPFAKISRARPSREIHWLHPKLVGEVAFSMWTDDGLVRHASFQGLRSDKPASHITLETALPAQALADAPAAKRAGRNDKMSRTSTTKSSKEAPGRRRKASAADNAMVDSGAVDGVAGIHISHGDRVIDPSSGITKAELVNFYARIAKLMLPHLAERAVSLVRAPAGIDGPHFFQKHLNALEIPNIRQLDADLFPGHPPLLVIDSLQGLISCAQMNVVEFHTWNATTADMARPDRIVFDLDPGEGVSWQQIQQGTLLTKTLLDELHLQSFLKTSGGKGLHIVVPLQPIADWDTARDFAQTLVKHLAKTLPSLFVAKSGPKNRIKRIFVDYLRNGLGATTACAFSARLRPGLGVSVPLRWRDLETLTGSAQWTVRDVDSIIEMADKKPWKGYTSKQNLIHATTLLKE